MNYEDFGKYLVDWTIEGMLLVIAILLIGNGIHIIPLSFGVTLGGVMDLRMLIWVLISFPIIGFLADKVQNADWVSHKHSGGPM